ncbi:acetyl-CoA C-acetyltransferase [Paraburkholderia sp. WC7.3d]
MELKLSRDVVVVSGVRTAIGGFGGSLASFPPTDLGARVVREALSRASVSGDEVGHVVFGNVVHSEPRDMYLARVAAINGGVAQHAPALTVNRLCGSGLQAIVSAAQCILLGDTDIAIGGGAESMSRAPYSMPAARFGQRMGDTQLVDMMVGALSDPFHSIHMGVTAENVAGKYDISREAQDALALESHRRAAKAIANGHFKEQILPITIPSKKGDVVFDTDEHVRHNATAGDFAKLRAVFAKENGTVTAGNSSGINDAAAAVVLMERSTAEKRGLKPLARLVAYAHAGVDPAYMGIGPVAATRNVLERAGLNLSELDVIEANEAFAAQACAVTKELGLDPAKVNPNGSGISLGHPIGATGALITVKALYELQRIGGRYALVTMCIGGGQGIAAIFERINV